jgi:alkylated DNA repair dioxygenase AlkB
MGGMHHWWPGRSATLVSSVTGKPAFQTGLFDRGPPAVDPTCLRQRLLRVDLDPTAWVDHLPGWVTGHAALMHELLPTIRWQQQSRVMYDRTVAVPRLIASVPEDGPLHLLLAQMRDALSAHYRTQFTRVSLAYYRDGSDGVAWHGDYVAREQTEAVVATVSLGEPRRFLLRPKSRGRSIAYSLGWGDLIVMGGSCQRTWQHAIPKVARALPRVSVMFRPEWFKSPR